MNYLSASGRKERVMDEPNAQLQPYKCPVCDGQGKLNKPPWVAGDQKEWQDINTGPYQCHACSGMGVLWK